MYEWTAQETVSFSRCFAVSKLTWLLANVNRIGASKSVNSTSFLKPQYDCAPQLRNNDRTSKADCWSPLDVVIHSPKLLLTSQIGLRATSWGKFHCREQHETNKRWKAFCCVEVSPYYVYSVGKEVVGSEMTRGVLSSVKSFAMALPAPIIHHHSLLRLVFKWVFCQSL